MSANERRPAGAASEPVTALTSLPADDDAWRDIVTALRREMGWGDCPPMIECPWCGADPGVACRVVMPLGHLRDGIRLRSAPRGCHPSRLELLKVMTS